MKSNMGLDKKSVLHDYRLACESRNASLIGRKEVLSGKAKFGIFGDGKEVAQLAMARVFRSGDWRAGYYRDQTLMMATGQLTIRQFFAQLFADTDIDREPHSAGRQMNNHPGTRYIDEQGKWLNQLAGANTSSDISPTGGQMPRLLGLAYASKIYRTNKKLVGQENFSSNGSEIAFGTIGNASTSEGVFWETMNAAGVLQVPLLMSVWDDGYGISVPTKYQTTKESISKAMNGFAYEDALKGIKIFVVKGFDYPALIETYASAATLCRNEHIPCLVHVTDMTQPQGHSTSGSHERYKSKDRLIWEETFDCIQRMSAWIVTTGIATELELRAIDQAAREFVEQEKQAAWESYLSPIERERSDFIEVLGKVGLAANRVDICSKAASELKKVPALFRRNIQSAMKRVLFQLIDVDENLKRPLVRHIERYETFNQRRYSSHLLCENGKSPLAVAELRPTYSDASKKVDGRQIIEKFFDQVLERDQRVFICGEDIGQLGGTNLEFDGLQDKYGELRVTDTGIREATILGQCLGSAMRGLRPIADIQYLDYLLYCFQTLSDDLATLHYRTAGGQAAPVIVRTKGHRLEGIWHSGSPMGTIIHGLRGMHVCVPRNMTQAAGFYNTLLLGDDPALVIEVLNGYRIKETMPDNIGTYTVALGVPEILQEGRDVTIVTYGACIRIAQEAIQILETVGISIELIDIQTLLPFDRFHKIKDSIEKTNALLCLDEDVPGGASAYMLQNILETQNGYDHLDAKPRTLGAQPHRAAYASDGDYYSKPNPEDVFECIYDMMHERNPSRWPSLR
ncbi:MAG: thiamine pyrophosphate-dependent enzyme [Proteobacteria bacterium]|nr:thiamine pyrophosphate-dependent enzyme [Pseudomonadota bacterium]